MMPLAPKLMRELSLGAGQFSALVAAYSIAAGVVGLLSAPFIDRFDRRTLLLCAYAGFTIATLFSRRISRSVGATSAAIGEIVSGDISSGASGDIQQATNMARAMVTQWGMSDRLGMVQYGNDDEYVFLGREVTRAKVYSEFTAQEIDGEVKLIIDNAYKIAKDILTTNIAKLELIAKSLLEYETLDGQQVEEIVRTGKFTAPPPAPQAEPPRGAPAGTPLPETPTKPAPPKLPGLGTPAPVTA